MPTTTTTTTRLVEALARHAADRGVQITARLTLDPDPEGVWHVLELDQLAADGTITPLAEATASSLDGCSRVILDDLRGMYPELLAEPEEA